ncbi:hypothetical protein [Enterobacter hormaechei]|nr:hypothetical protein [Enterobacter hormaechei]
MVIAEDMRTWSMASFESGWRCSFFRQRVDCYAEQKHADKP